ncbi:hypothetical protein DID80_03600 [Candidatus Marinamargulisbacteria bacterium SCGC AAA071-K20]|nr:hypothetical protein DID80_03600 [Candidatus Marinamargulisbacteria bacterium SCGC AAA071-K20]
MGVQSEQDQTKRRFKMNKSIHPQPLTLTVSFACIAHCFLTPVILLFAPFLGTSIKNPMAELSMLMISIGSGIYIIHSGFCTHKKKHTFVLFFSGATLWICHAMFEYFEIIDSKLFLLLGTCFVIGSYLFNHHYLKCCRSCSN